MNDIETNEIITTELKVDGINYKPINTPNNGDLLSIDANLNTYWISPFVPPPTCGIIYNGQTGHTNRLFKN